MIRRRPARSLLTALLAIPLLAALVVPTEALAAKRCRIEPFQPSSNFTGHHHLQDVDASSAKNVWAVGYAGSVRGIAWRWNGKRWGQVKLAKPGAPWTGWSMQAVAVRKANDAWAFGQVYDATGARLLVEHWNGKRWRVVTTIDLGLADFEFEIEGAVAVSATDVWVAGDARRPEGWKPFAIHYDGNTWTSTPIPDEALTFNGIAGSAAAGIWVAGEISAYAQFLRPAVFQWKGGAWVRQTEFPDAISRLDGIDATAAEGVIGVGSSLAVHGPSPAWAIQPVPVTTEPFRQLTDVAIRGPNDAWAIGRSGNNLIQSDRPYIRRWNGTAWTSGSWRFSLGGVLLAITSVPGSRVLYAVGYFDQPVFGVPDDLLIVTICRTMG